MSSGSQPSSSGRRTKVDKVKGPGGKLLVTLTEDGCVDGPNAATFTTRSSEAVRNCIPINSGDWRTVDSSFKDDIWTKILEEFEFNIDIGVARLALEPHFSQRLRTWKYLYRSKILDTCESIQEKINRCPDGIDVNHWKEFVVEENSEKVKERRKKNGENRNKIKGSHTNGRRSYAQCMYNELEQNPGAKIRRVDLWYKGQVRADGIVLETSKEAYEKVKEADERLKETPCEDGMKSISVEIDSDALHEVFGAEKKNRVRAVSSSVSKKKLQQSSLAKAVLVGPSSEIAEVKGNVAALKEDFAGLKTEVKSDIAGVNNKIEFLTDLITTYFRQKGSEQLPSTPNSRTEIGSTSVNPTNQNVQHSSELTPNNASEKVNPPVKLLNNEGAVVATGYVVTDGLHAKVCHGRNVGLGEKKVYVESVLFPQTPVYAAPQNGMKVLEDIIEGGYLVWLECWLQY